MKKLSFLIVCCLLIKNSFATIWLVDNNPNHPVPQTNLQVAIDNAANGDTIMVAGSNSSYGDITINKQLVIIGEGYNDALGENTTVGLALIQSSNVLFTGFKATQTRIFALNAPGGQLENVTVERCSTAFLFGGGNLASPKTLRDIHIRNNISSGAIWIVYNGGQDYIVFDSLIVENNIFSDPSFFNWASGVVGTNTIIIRNNLFINGSNWCNGGSGCTLFYDGFTGSNLHDAILYNNIFYDCNPSGSVNCTFMNNLTYGNGSGVNAPFGTGANDTLVIPFNNNIYSQDPRFISFAPLQPVDFNKDFHLQAGSPCIGTGVGGSDIGIYGGYYPYNVGEGPRIPVVDFVNISSSAVPQGSTFYLQFDARVRE